jgi:hypothetical protein
MSVSVELDEIDSITFKAINVEEPLDTSRHYIDDDMLTEAMAIWRSDTDKSKLEKSIRPPIPVFVAECVISLATAMIKRHNYVNYSYGDEMISDAILNCTKYAHNFSATKKNQKGKNSAFTYLNFIISKSFNNRILKEKREQFLKYASYSLMGGHDAFGDEIIGSDDTDDSDVAGVSVGLLGNDFIAKALEYELKYGLIKKEKTKKVPKTDMFAFDLFGTDDELEEIDLLMGMDSIDE